MALTGLKVIEVISFDTRFLRNTRIVLIMYDSLLVKHQARLRDSSLLTMALRWSELIAHLQFRQTFSAAGNALWQSMQKFRVVNIF